ncbi:MAG: hypothetical protein KGJ11_01070 [Candidatus Omnitrophica bacterium]|nr:hypothetical protein [Candidatus Omnitrophota bacterium]
MGAIKMTLELYQKGILKDTHSVMEMGSQGLHISIPDLEELLQMAGLSNYRKKDFGNLKRWPEGSCSSKVFYEILGIKEYACIDLCGGYGAIDWDLNRPWEDKSYENKYDLVTDHGTNEHVFNTAEAYRTMHRLCKPGGLLVILQAPCRGNGYFAFEPLFFTKMSEANDYKILFSSYLVTPAVLTPHGSAHQYHVPVSGELIDALDWSKVSHLGIAYVMQKQSKADFRYPKQENDLSKSQQRVDYLLQFLQGPPEHSYVPLAPESVRGKHFIAECRRRIYSRIKSR